MPRGATPIGRAGRSIQKYFSMGETLAHLIYLVREGRILQGICGHEYYFRMPYDRKNLALAPGRLASA